MFNASFFFIFRRYQSNNEDYKKLKKRQSLPTPTSNVIPIPSPTPRGSNHNNYNQKAEIGAASYAKLTKYPSVNCSEIDSLDSNYHNKSSYQVSQENLNAYKTSEENLDYNDLGLSLPNYYPDNKYDTDVSVTAENISIYSDTEYFDGNSRSLPTYAYEYDSSLSDLEPRYYESNTFNPIFNEYNYESVSDSCSELNNFDEITVNNNKNKEDSGTENKNTENTENKELDYEKTISLNGKKSPTLTIKSESTLKGSITNEKVTSSDSENVKENSETTDEITKSDEAGSKLSESCDYNEIKNDIYATIQKPSDDHITLITIDPPENKKNKFFNAKKTKSPTDIKRQNYLKDLLESNTNKRPLKNFITKNISRAFGDKKSNNKLISTENYVTTLVENQYHSLPDINASKYLQKCEKIDRKLRKCEKVTRTQSNLSTENTKNRFVVNIGKHLNIPNQNAPIPVDFEVKISKVPKIQKTPVKSNSFAGRNTTSVKINGAENKHFTLQQKTDLTYHKPENKSSNFSTITRQTKEKLLAGFKKNSEAKTTDKSKIKPLPKIAEVIEKKDDKHKENSDIKTIRTYTKIDEKPEYKYTSCSELDSLEYSAISEQELIDTSSEYSGKMEKQLKNKENNNDKQNSNSSSPVQEYQEKLGTMRCFWDKMINGIDSNKSEDKKELNNCNGKQEETNLNNDIIHESPPPKLTISRFESMKEEKNENKKPEPCKIVDVQSKIENVRKIFETPEKSPESSPGLVETNRKKFEPKLEKYDDKMGSFVKDACGIYENPYFERYNSSSSYSASESSNQFESLNPNIVEIIEQEKEKQENIKEVCESKTIKEIEEIDSRNKLSPINRMKTTTLIKSKSFDQGPEFDHVRYKVMKSDLFQKNIFANYEKESQFDGLMQYLQDYSFQELLIDNNIVIIEPIRTKVEFSDVPKKTKKVTHIIPKPISSDAIKESKQSPLRRHFFYHPIRVNREVNDSELPNPDTVKQVRQLFEKTGVMKKSQSHNEIDNPPKKKTIRYQTVIDPDRDHCSESDMSSEHEKASENELVEESGFESIPNDNCCDRQYVSEDVLQKIRECGTCVTYYGGKVLETNNNKHSPLTKAIMEEIKGTQKRNEECVCRRKNKNLKAANKNLDCIMENKQQNNCKILEDKITFKPATKTTDQKSKEVYQGIKFKLIKSNSCSSRLELVGTENMSEYRKKFLERQKMIIDEQNLKNKQMNINNHDKIESIKEIKETLNNDEEKEVSKLNIENGETEKNQKPSIILETPKIVAEEKKINGNKMTQWGSIPEEKQNTQISKDPNTRYIDYKEYEKIRRNSRKFNDMEFESYEVLEN